MAWKSREEGESEMLWEQGDIDEKVIWGGGVFNLRYDKGWGDVEFDVPCNPLRSPLTPLVGLN